MSRTFSINFEVVPPEKAVVSVMDRSFLYGDSVYEVVRTYNGSTPFLADRHFARLKRSASRIGLELPFSFSQWSEHLKECVEASGEENAYIRTIVSRGVDDRFDLRTSFSQGVTTVVLTDQAPTYPSAYFSEGVKVSLVSVRRNNRQSLDPNIKSGNYLNNILALKEACKKEGYLDAIMLNHLDQVTEATTSNVFMVKANTILTPFVENGILEGITRGFLKDILQEENLDFREANISKDEFLSADEVFLTSTLKEVMPVVKVDDTTIGEGAPGKWTQKLMDLFSKERNLALGSDSA